MESFLQSVEADLRNLSTEARKPESLAGQLAGWLVNSEHPEVKVAAERFRPGDVIKARIVFKSDAYELKMTIGNAHSGELCRQVCLITASFYPCSVGIDDSC